MRHALFLLCLAVPSFGGLITNGGFETGDFTGWTVTGAMEYYGVGTCHVEGSHCAWFGDVLGLTYISQEIATTPGQTYRISFWLRNLVDFEEVDPEVGPVNYAGLWWDGVLIGHGENDDPYPWQWVQMYTTATASSTELKLGFMNPPGNFRIDQIEVGSPEPATATLFGAGVLALLAYRARRRCRNRT